MDLHNRLISVAAIAAKVAYNNQFIYPGSCQMQIMESKMEDITIKIGDRERARFTMMMQLLNVC